MLKPPLSPNSKKTKRRQLLSLNRPRNTTPKVFDDTITTHQSSPPRSPVSIATSPPMTLNEDIIESPKPTEKTPTSLGEYYCPICNKDLSAINTSYSRQQHIDGCLSSTDDSTTANDMTGDDQSLESLFMDYCSFCGKHIAHLKGIHKERHFDQCLTALETEQKLAEQQQQRTTYASHSIPFLQDLDVCPVCHDTLPGPSLRNKIAHIKRCAKQRSLTMEQLLRKIQWMQWGHLPIQNTLSAKTTTTTTTDTSSTTAPPISYSIYATEHPPPSTNPITATRSTPSLITTKKRTKQAEEDDYTSSQGTFHEPEHDHDDDFKTDVLIYRVASWQQTRFKKQKYEPTEEESIAMALSLSLMNEDEQQQQRLVSKRSLAKRKKRKVVNLDMANIVSIEESRALAKLALAKLLDKHNDDGDGGGGGSSSMPQFPLVTSRVRPNLPRRQDALPCGPLSIPSTSLWSQASFLDSD